MSANPSRHRDGILLAAGTAVISGFAVFINGYGVRAWSDIADATTYTTLKNLVAAVVIGFVMAGLAFRGSAERPSARTSSSQRLGLVAIAIIGGSVPFVLFFEGLARASSLQAAFLHKTLVIWVALLALVFLKERLSWPHVAAIGLLVWGQVVVVGSLETVVFGWGEGMILAATLLWSVEVIVAKRALARWRPAGVAGARMLGGSVVLIVWVLVRGLEINWTMISGAQWLWILLTGSVLSSYVLTWFGALSRAPAIDVTAVLVAGAVVTAILQTTVRGVALPSPVGLALLSFGALVAALGSRRRRLGAPDR